MMTGKSRHVTLEELDKWFAGAQPGEALIYCLGHLAMDRVNGLVLPELANRVLRIAAQGHGYLYQRRRGHFDYEYCVVRARKRGAWQRPPIAVEAELIA